MTQAVRRIDALRNTTSVREILQVATSFEVSARDFYTDLSPKVSKQIRYLVEELAAEQQGHFDMLAVVECARGPC